MTFDINDPSTWDNLSTEELAKLAAGTPESPSEPDEKPAEETPEDKPAQPKAKEEELPAKDATPPAPAQELTIDGIPVLTKDGSHVIPHSVLKSTRERARAAEERLKALEAELEAAKKPATPAEPNPSATPAAPQGDLSEAIKAKAEKMRSDWGDDIAEQYLENERLKLEITEIRNSLKTQGETTQHLKQSYETEQAAKARTEEEQIQDAIDANPALAAWQADQQSNWFDLSVQLHQMLMQTDSKYASLGWAERFSALPAKVNALYGAPLPKAPEPKPTAAAVEAQAKAKLDAATREAPASMTDIPAGTPAETSESTKLESMSGADIQAHFDKLAKDPKQLQAYLRSLA